MWFAERTATQLRGERELGMKDAIVVGLVQVFSLVPGVSRSGATISAGLLRGLDRVTATRLSFFLSIPALLAAGLFELKDALGGDIGVGETLVGTLVSFVVAYAPSPGCSGSWRTTRSRGSCPTASRSAYCCWPCSAAAP